MESLAHELRTAPTTFRPFRPDPVSPAALGAALERARLALGLEDHVRVDGILVARPVR
jgi:hypothetical protein